MRNGSISLRPVETSDLDKLHKWRNDKTIFDNLGGGFFPRSHSQMSKWMDSFIENTEKNQRFIICIDEVAVGFISLNDINYRNRTCNLGLYIGEHTERGKGTANKSFELLKDYSKSTLNLRKISLNVLEDNEGAISLYKKCGFEICGLKIKERYVDGVYKNVVLMEMFI